MDLHAIVVYYCDFLVVLETSDFVVRQIRKARGQRV